MAKKSRREIADLLLKGRIETARLRVEGLIQDDIYVELLELLEVSMERNIFEGDMVRRRGLARDMWWLKRKCVREGLSTRCIGRAVSASIFSRFRAFVGSVRQDEVTGFNFRAVDTALGTGSSLNPTDGGCRAGNVIARNSSVPSRIAS